MEDGQIIELYWLRDERAIPETAGKYGAYCGAIAENILRNPQDAEECVSDTYLKAWTSIPPQRPAHLAAFLGRITRNLSLNRLAKLTAAKRGGGETPECLRELEDIVSGRESVEAELDRRELTRAIDAFLGLLPQEKRSIFLRRYWYFDSARNIAARFKMSENSVNVTLSRLRRKLRDYLTGRGFDI